MSLGNVLGAAAPIAAGFMTGGASTPFLGMTGATAGLAAGALTGAGIAALTGQDPLMGGITGALGGYGGADLAGGLGAFGKTAAEKTMLANKFVQNPVNAAFTSAATPIPAHLSGGIGATTPFSAVDGAMGAVQNAGVMPSFMTASKGIPAIDPTKFVGAQQPSTLSPLMTQSKGIPLNTPRNLDTMMAAGGYGGGPDIGLGISEALDRPTDFFKEFGGGSTTKGALKTAGTLGSPFLAAFEPEVQTFDELRGDKYDPDRRLNLDEIDTGIGAALKRDTGLRLVKEGGHIKGYKGGGPLSRLLESGNTQGTMTNTSTGQATDMSGQSMLDMLRRAGVVKYEEGGDVGMGAPEFIKQENESYVTLDNDYRLLMSGRLSWEEYSSNPRNVEYFRDEMRREALDREGEEAIKYEDGGAVAPVTSGESYDALIASGVHPMNAMYAAGFTGEELGYTPEGFKPTTGLGEGETPGTDAYAAGLDVPPGTELTAAGKYIYPIIPSYYYGTSDRKITPTATGGIKSLKDMAGGGYLETGGRVGDGMSDDIKARINNQQEARLSDGEFVLPADVVSHLGNGSSDAGAKRLYSMMDRIRQARTGNSKQGKEIKAERYMPA